MRALVLFAALGAAGAAGAQVPAAPTPTPTSQSAAPKAPKSSGGEFRVGGFMISGDRSLEFGNNPVSNNTGSMKGLDVVLRAKAIGLQFKSITGTFEGQPNVTSADARILLFPPVFTVMVGAGRRALWSDLNPDAPTQVDLGMVGVSSTVTIGGSGLRTNFQAAMYLPVPEANGASGTASQQSDEKAKGMEGEASVIWHLPKVPFFIQAGYRTEVFTSKNGTPEEVRGMKIGGGLLLGGR